MPIVIHLSTASVVSSKPDLITRGFLHSGKRLAKDRFSDQVYDPDTTSIPPRQNDSLLNRPPVKTSDGSTTAVRKLPSPVAFP